MAVASSPIATADQHEVERRALALREHPLLQRARDELREEWPRRAAPSAEMRDCFDAFFEEVMYCAAVWSLNQDPERPKVITVTRLPHQLGELRIPGSRYGIDNPDSIYRVIPIDGRERYVIRGQVGERRLTENYFVLWDAKMNTVDVLSGHDLELGHDRRFEITVDSAPANGRRNHVRSSPAAHEFFIRDVLQDWSRDEANTLSVEKLGAPRTPPRSEDEQAALTARMMRDWVEHTLRWNAQALTRPANDLSFAIDRESDGALRHQLYRMGHFRIGDDEALVLRVTTGGARYFIAPITNVWGATNDIVHRSSSLNLAQSLPNPDGSYTLVVSLRDPGVPNWLDPCDMHEGILTLRWAEFPSGRGSQGAGASSELVPLSRLARALPPGTPQVGPEERRRRLDERARSYAWRLRDH